MKVCNIGYIQIFTILNTLLLSGIAWLIGWHISAIHFPVAFILSVVILHCFRKNIIKDVSISLLLMLFVILLSAIIPDGSYDGQAYHQPMIYALSHGWNPVYDSHNTIISDNWEMNIWIDHYCKGMETVSATIVAMTGNLESGKAVSWLLGLSSLFLICDFLGRSVGEKTLNFRKKIFYTLCLALPPIFATQVFSYYIDLCGYFTVVWLIVALYGIYSRKAILDYLLMSAAIILAGSTKFNMLFWVGFFTLIFLIFLFVQKKYRLMNRVIAVAVGAVVLTILTSGFNPYITNTIDHCNPIYPLGIGDKDTEYLNDGAQPLFLQKKNRVIQILYSYTSRPSNILDGKYIPPYIVTENNIMSAGSPGARIGGGGIVFVDILLLSFILYAISKRSSMYKNTCIFIGVLLSSLLILPMGSSYRYVPFFYILPIVILLYTEYAGFKYNIGKWLRRLVYILLVLNVSMAMTISLGYSIINKCVTEYYVKAIQQTSPQYFRSKNWSFNYKVFKDEIIKYDPTEIGEDTIDYKEIPFQKSIPIYVNREELDKTRKGWVTKFLIK
ncbi:hypothetical protein FNW54_11775 [Bacteroides sp. HF-5092]|nr:MULTISPECIES: hypothetical protein [Bacteroides]MDB0716233.1 hypothetical protein [Bacteroides xylanisolvens]TRX45236.1 hypothetical protein FNW54_11775 [Bacteroides sp. HF-5092]